jgi:hypothetical protein
MRIALLHACANYVVLQVKQNTQNHKKRLTLHFANIHAFTLRVNSKKPGLVESAV